VLGAVQQKGCPGKKEEMFTKEYIEMVIKAKEIQDLCKYKKGDWFIGTFAFYHSEKPKPKVFCKSGLGSFDPREHSWLPTLEDLFGIWCNLCGATNFAGLCQRITERKSNLVMYPNMKFIKELCLETIMKEFYNKFWNPEKKEWEAID
jgi:predicted nucleic-acid-binding Zn-ribbon protein